MSSPQPRGSESYAYSPYGSARPSSVQPAPVRRPALMALALVLMIVASVPFLLLGTLLLVAPLSPDDLPAELAKSPRLVQAGATPELLISAFRLLGAVVLAGAVIYLLFGVLAFLGRGWARICLAVLTAGYVLLLVAALVVGGGAVDTVAVAGLCLVVLLGAAVILFTPGVNAWYARRR